MCGINGIIGKNGSTAKLEAMQQILNHRGPDAQERYVNEQFNCYLGHNRLSIIDLSPYANQPMHSNDGQYIVVHNGEIYNYLELRKELSPFYSFKTKSDTEVILAAFKKWGENCLEHFIGMFAFVIWDTKSKKIFAARDRFGVKPFYYTIKDNTFYFSSEIKGIWASGAVKKKPNELAWLTYWRKGLYDHNTSTFWEGISKLDAGCMLSFSAKEDLSIKRWYDIESVLSDVDNRKEELVYDELLHLLEDSVRLRFRSDVPVGICLSGGLDSSLLLALVQRVKGKDFPIHAFTFYTGDERYDELPWTQKMVENTSVIHHPCKLSVKNIPNLAKELSLTMDEPYGGIPTIGMRNVFKEAAQKGIKVLLDGNGMDEAWAGYDYYQRADQVIYDKGPVQGSQKVLSLNNFLNPDIIGDVDCLNSPMIEDKLRCLQYRDLMHTKIQRGMRFADRNSMAFSIELREPFLDHRMVELGLRQKKNLKIRNNVGKYLPRKIAKNIIDKTIVEAPKRPLQTPQREWLAEDLAEWVDSILGQPNSNLWNWFDKKSVNDLVSDYRRTRPDNSFYLWQLINSAILLDSE